MDKGEKKDRKRAKDREREKQREKYSDSWIEREREIFGERELDRMCVCVCV